MSPSARRILIPIIVVAIALGVVFAGLLGGGGTGSKATPGTPGTPGPTAPAGASAAVEQDSAAESADGSTVEGTADATSDAMTEGGGGGDAATDAPATPGRTYTTLRAVAPPIGVSGHDSPAASLGSLDREVSIALVEFSRAGAGIHRITFSDIWETGRARRQADAHYAQLGRGLTPTTPLPADEFRYVLLESQNLVNNVRPAGVIVPVLAARQVTINGVAVDIFDYTRDADDEKIYVWAETGPGAFETSIVDEDGTPVARLVRRFTMAPDYEITIEQRLSNLTDLPLTVSWIQDGPRSLRIDRSRYLDRRRARFGYLENERRDPARTHVLADDNALLLERTDILKRWKKAGQAATRDEQIEFSQLWPNKTSTEKEYELSWFGLTNRYFALTVHPLLDAQGNGSRSLTSLVSKIYMEVSEPGGPAASDATKLAFTYLLSPERTVPAGGELALDLGAYAGPLDRHILQEQPMATLGMPKLILFQMSSMCAICTFQWLAYGLLDFLSLLHDWVVFDWGLAIICLVLVVRTLLHPLTKRSQISMQRFGKQMSSMKPELDKLQKKFPGDAKRLQQEQMKLMREHGANPLQMLGCLPMFLQTPIWIALYAMLYFTFDLRQEPAFFGIFQKITGGAWSFLGDLSASDHFFGELDEPVKFLMWNVTGFNLLPLLMGLIFYVQQKYMSPPPSPTMTEDQIKQQKIMKVMMVVMFPLMLYSAPSGLTLYILTSSCIGILESRYVRQHIKEMDLNPPEKKTRKKVKPKDAQGRAFAAAIERREEERRRRKKPERTFKKRK